MRIEHIIVIWRYISIKCEVHYENTPIQLYRKFHLQKLKIFRLKTDSFHISAQNIDCRYSLEPPRRGGSNEYPQSMFLTRNKRNNIYPCKPQFYYVKVGFKGIKLYRRVFVMSRKQHWLKPHSSFPTDPFERCFFCSSSLFVRLWFHARRLFCHYLFLISPSFSSSGRLCFWIVAFPGYLHLYFYVSDNGK